MANNQMRPEHSDGVAHRDGQHRDGDHHVADHRDGAQSPGHARDREELVGLFKLLSDGTRLDLLMLLAKGERNVTTLCEELGLPQPTVSHHLGLLRMSNVISNRRSGKKVFYSLNGRVERPNEAELVVFSDSHAIIVAERTAVGRTPANLRRIDRAMRDGDGDGDGRA